MYTYIYIYNIYIHIRDAIRNFSGQGRFLEKKANLISINISSRTHKRKTPQGTISEFFLLDILKIVFQITNSIFREFFFPKSGHFFSIFTKGQGSPPLKLAKILKILKILRLRF